MNPYFSREFLILIQNFPIKSLFYSFFLTLIASLVLWIFEYTNTRLPSDIGDNMFLYLIAIVAWLVTTRPAYALTIHDVVTDLINQILIQFDNLDEPIESAILLWHITDNLLCPQIIPVEINEPLLKSKNAKKIRSLFYQFTFRSAISLPRSFHSLCLFLIFGFHSFLVPLILFDQNYYYCLIPNFFLAIYTTSCLEVANTITFPYQNLKDSDSTIPALQYQLFFERMLLKLQKEKDKNILQWTLKLDQLNMPKSIPQKKPHPCALFVLPN